jgi:hypothetical protein
MRKFLSYFLFTLLLAAIACACSDDLGIKRDYEFEVTHLPVQSKIKVGETAEIRFQLAREGRWEDTKFYMRYFQSSGKGELKTADGMVFLPNDLYEMPEETFRLYYTSHSTDQQVIDLYFLDSFGTMVTLSFSFTNESDSTEEGNEED